VSSLDPLARLLGFCLIGIDSGERVEEYISMEWTTNPEEVNKPPRDLLPQEKRLIGKDL
jgi:hypothetical protein